MLALSYLYMTIAHSSVSSATFTDYPHSLAWRGAIWESGCRQFPKGAARRI